MAIDTPQFRYLSEYEDYLIDMKEEIGEIVQLVDQQKRLLASSLRGESLIAASEPFVVKIGENPTESKKRMARLARKSGKESTKIVIPNKAALNKKYKLAEDLYEKLRTLETVEAQVVGKFKGTKSKAFNTELTLLKDEVKEALKKTLSFIREIANKHVPKSFQKFVDSISDEVDEHLPYTSGKNYMYVSTTSAGSLVFTHYKMMEKAINDDGSITPVLYAVVQWVVGTTDEEPITFVYLLHQFEPPNELLLRDEGVEVNTVLQAVQGIAELLSLESFSTELGVVPLSLAFLKDPDSLGVEYFSPRDVLKSVNVQEQQITFTADKRKVKTKKVFDNLGQQLFLEVKPLIRNHRNARLRTKLDFAKGTITFTYISVAGDLEFSNHDAEFMQDRFGLSSTQLRRIVHVMNNG